MSGPFSCLLHEFTGSEVESTQTFYRLYRRVYTFYRMRFLLNLMFFHVKFDVGRNWTWAPAALTCLTRGFSKKKKVKKPKNSNTAHASKPKNHVKSVCVCVCVCVGMLAGWYWLSVSHSPLLTSCALTPLISCHVRSRERWYKQSTDAELHHTLSLQRASGASSSEGNIRLPADHRPPERADRLLTWTWSSRSSNVFWSQVIFLFSVNQWLRVFHGVLQHSLARQPLSASWNSTRICVKITGSLVAHSPFKNSLIRLAESLS